jgi:hypothetical protein
MLSRNGISSIALVLAIFVAAPASAAAFNTGDVFAAVGNGQVNHYTNSGTFVETLTDGQGGYTTGMAFDASGNLSVTNFSAGSISRFNPSGTLLAPNPIVSPGASPESIVFNTSGDFYVGRATGQVQKYSGAGALQQTYGMPVSTDWIDLASDQTTLFYNDESGQIRRWNVSTNSALADFADNTAHGGTKSFALRILGNGDVLSAANSQINQYNSAGTFLGSYDATGIDAFFALNLDPDGTHFWTGSYGNQQLYKFTINNFGVNTFSTSFNTGGSLFGVALKGEITAGAPEPGPNAGVPEPSVWIMMILGFGMTGSMLRARRCRHSTVT